ncbi:hypothetical protein OPIT5_06860 [Opitutaceae bacterium TAV5]|nr:hypothetical protein OPIT5_06860 [Opitutaceae bacterium TAV5]
MPLFAGILLALATGVQSPAAAMLASSDATQIAAVRITNRIDIDKVWSGHPVGFALLTDAARNLQYVAYYDARRIMTVASRTLDSREWKRQSLDSLVGWDSHNNITLALDRYGYLHVVGNLHVSPLVYFRTTRAGDISTLVRIPRMVGEGERETLMTYPKFRTTSEGRLTFNYRDGRSGCGDTIYNVYDEATRSWSRLLDRPLFDGQGRMNAYPLGPELGPDGWWHMTWVWRDNKNAETNHDLGYARSPDLVRWETNAGQPITLPIRHATPGVTLDPVPVNGGILNGSGKVGFDKENRVLVIWHKFDANGNTQLYLGRSENGNWRITQLTKWEYRWEPRGGGSISTDVRHSEPRYDPKVGFYVATNHVKYGNAIWGLNLDSFSLGKRISVNHLSNQLPNELSAITTPYEGMQRRMSEDLGTPPSGKRYILRWETLPPNRDQPRRGQHPSPSTIELVELTLPRSP